MRLLRFRSLIVPVALAVTVLVAAAQPASPATAPTATCEHIALRLRSGSEDGYRVVLGRVGVPDAQHTGGRASRGPEKEWPYFRRVGLVVRGGTSPVTITVPEGWRDRVAISWGNTPAVSSLQIASCDVSVSKPWNAYAGGFHLRSRADCVPLDIRVGGRSTTVRLGVGRACGAGH
jgi:hypothetical protein